MNKYIKWLIIAMLLFCSINYSILAQKETYNWYFGDSCAISFMPDGDKAEFVNGCIMKQMEGSASISDKDGQLLFYSEGTRVWNSKSELLNNGGNLMGYTSSSRGAILLPRPYSNRYYYLFTISAIERCVEINGQIYNRNGLRYSVIDRFADYIKDGDIDVRQKNVLLLEDAVEKLIAVNHSNGADIWLVTFNWKDNNYYVYLITKDGISSPQKFQRPFPIIKDPNKATYNLDYDIASRRLIDCDNSLNCFVIYDFNTSTGKISIETPLALPAYYEGILEDSIRLHVPYSGAFSADGKKFYGSCYQRGIVQYDFSEENESAIIASRYVIADINTPNIGNILFGAIRKGPDNKIYVARDKYNYLGIIDEPNGAKDECNFISDGLYLEGKKCRYGLPIMLEYKPLPCEYDGYAGGDKQICNGEYIVLGDIIAETTNLEFEWFPKDYLDNPYALNPICYASQNMQYVLMVRNIDLDCFDYDTINVIINEAIKYNSAGDFEVCSNNTITIGNLNNSDDLVYEWRPATFLDNPSTKMPNCTPTRNIQYILTIRDTISGCSIFDTINVNIKTLNVELEGALFICEGKNTTLKVVGDYVSYLWSNGDITNSITIDEEGIYWVKVKDNNGCEGTKNIEIKELVADNFNIVAPSTICSGIPTILSTNVDFYSYLWSTGETTPTIEIITSGTYWVIVENENGCQIADTCEINETIISYSIPDKIDFGYVCQGEQIDTIAYFTNTSEEIITISSISLINGTNFFLNTPQQQYYIEPYDALAFDLTFLLNQNGYYSDTLVIKIYTPCETILYIPLDAATDANNFNVTLQDQQVFVGDSTIIPISIAYQNNSNEQQFEIDFTYRWDIITPTSCENATIINKQRDSLWETATLHLFYPPNINEMILSLNVRTTLGCDDYISPMTISDLRTELNCYEWNGDTAKLELLGCALDYYKIKFFTPTKIEAISPSSKIICYISTSEIGTLILSVYDVLGNECYKKEWINNEKIYTTKKIELNELSLTDGIYIVRLLTPNDLLVIRAVIIN